MSGPIGAEELRWKRALLATIGQALRAEPGAGGDPALLARIGNLIYSNSGDDFDPVAPEAMPASPRLEAGASGTPVAGRCEEQPPPFSTALLDSARIYLAENAFDDALRFAKVAALTAAREGGRAGAGAHSLDAALAMIAEIGYAAGRAGARFTPIGCAEGD